MRDAAQPERCSRGRKRRRTTLSVVAAVAAVAVAITFLGAAAAVSLALASLPLISPRDRSRSFPPRPVMLASFLRWSGAQLVRSAYPPSLPGVARILEAADRWEAEAWEAWEGSLSSTTRESASNSRGGSEREDAEATGCPLSVPALDLAACRLNGRPLPVRAPPRGANGACLPAAADLAAALGTDFLSRPLLLRGLWTAEDLARPDRRLSLLGLSSHPDLAGLAVPYYTDASEFGYSALSPGGVAPLGDVVRNVTADRGGRQKLGTQVPVEAHPDLIEEVAAPRGAVTELFGDRFRPQDVVGSGPWGILPASTTVPVFLANSRNAPAGGSGGHLRTDLHCEPIGNVAVQLAGAKAWTLVPPSETSSLRPSVSKRGRAFFYSNLLPGEADGAALGRSGVDCYGVTTGPGDALWVPPWMWHRVDYRDLPSPAAEGGRGEDEEEHWGHVHGNGHGGGASLAASLFHFRPIDFCRNNPLFAMLVVPNLIKELMGRKTE